MSYAPTLTCAHAHIHTNIHKESSTYNGDFSSSKYKSNVMKNLT